MLLIRGGVYADMDVMLTSTLDEVVAGDVGFMTPMDSVSFLFHHPSPHSVDPIDRINGV